MTAMAASPRCDCPGSLSVARGRSSVRAGAEGAGKRLGRPARLRRGGPRRHPSGPAPKGGSSDGASPSRINSQNRARKPPDSLRSEIARSRCHRICRNCAARSSGQWSVTNLADRELPFCMDRSSAAVFLLWPLTIASGRPPFRPGPTWRIIRQEEARIVGPNPSETGRPTRRDPVPERIASARAEIRDGGRGSGLAYERRGG